MNTTSRTTRLAIFVLLVSVAGCIGGSSPSDSEAREAEQTPEHVEIDEETTLSYTSVDESGEDACNGGSCTPEPFDVCTLAFDQDAVLLVRVDRIGDVRSQDECPGGELNYTHRVIDVEVVEELATSHFTAGDKLALTVNRKGSLGAGNLLLTGAYELRGRWFAGAGVEATVMNDTVSDTSRTQSGEDTSSQISLASDVTTLRRDVKDVLSQGRTRCPDQPGFGPDPESLHFTDPDPCATP